MTITVPDAFRTFVADQVAMGKYANENEWFCALLKEEQVRKVRQEIEKKLLEALEEEPTELTKQDWDEMRAEVQRRHKERESNRHNESSK